MLTITIHQSGPSRYAATLNDRVLVESSRIPLLDSARTLLTEGHPPHTILAMRRTTGPISMSGSLDRLAGLTVRDDDRGLRFEPYRAHPGETAEDVPPVAHQRPPALHPSEDLCGHPTAVSEANFT